MRKTLAAVAASALLLAACHSAAEQPAMQAGTVWQNGNEIYIVEDSASFWQLYGGTLHEGGFEMKLTKDGKWIVPTIVDNKPTDSIAGTWQLAASVLRLTDARGHSSELHCVGGLTVASRDEIPSRVLPALDSVQQTNVFRQLEGSYTDNNGKTWTFHSNTLRRMGKSTVEKYAIGKSLDMNDSVIFTDNIAYAYRINKDGVSLYKAKYNDDVDAWEYTKDKANLVVTLKRK